MDEFRAWGEAAAGEIEEAGEDIGTNCQDYVGAGEQSPTRGECGIDAAQELGMAGGEIVASYGSRIHAGAALFGEGDSRRHALGLGQAVPYHHDRIGGIGEQRSRSPQFGLGGWRREDGWAGWDDVYLSNAVQRIGGKANEYGAGG